MKKWCLLGMLLGLLIGVSALADAEPAWFFAAENELAPPDEFHHCIDCECDHANAKASSGPVNPWKGTNVGLGLTINTGNTRDSDYNASANVNYRGYRWSNFFEGTAQLGFVGSQTTKEQFFAQNQVNYLFTSSFKSFLYASGNITVDKFSPYDYQSVFSVGYGRDIIKTCHFLLSVQAGPGLRRYQDRDDSEDHNNAVLSTQLYMSWKLFHSGELTESATFNYGSPYSYVKSVTAFTNAITKNLALQIAFTVSHYTQIPPNSTRTQKTDTTTTASIVYNFVV